MKMIEDVLAALPTEFESGSYDGMIVAPAHYERVRAAHPEQTETVFIGVTIVANAGIPEGFAIITRDGRPCGVIDFSAGSATLTRPSRDPSGQH